MSAARNIVSMCRGCGCTDDRACPGGCIWVLVDVDSPTGICSACAAAVDFDQAMMANVGFDEELTEQFVAILMASRGGARAAFR